MPKERVRVRERERERERENRREGKKGTDKGSRDERDKMTEETERVREVTHLFEGILFLSIIYF